MKTGFAVQKKGNVWVLQMQGTETEGTFGSLRACMQAAYCLTDAEFSDDPAQWTPDRYGETFESCEALYSG